MILDLNLFFNCDFFKFNLAQLLCAEITYLIINNLLCGTEVFVKNIFLNGLITLYITQLKQMSYVWRNIRDGFAFADLDKDVDEQFNTNTGHLNWTIIQDALCIIFVIIDSTFDISSTRARASNRLWCSSS